MKYFLFALVLSVVLVGCSKNNPVETSSDATVQADAMFGEQSMVNVATASSVNGVLVADSGGCVHDSLRNQHMLDSLKAYLTLTDEQFVQLQQLGTTLFSTLKDIRAQVKAGTITRDSAKVLVTASRDQFVASVKLILTTEQLALFETWITDYWNKPIGHGGGRHHGPHGGKKK